jgi:hypothetical protein
MSWFCRALPEFDTLGNMLDGDHEVLDHPLIVQAVAGINVLLIAPNKKS